MFISNNAPEVGAVIVLIAETGRAVCDDCIASDSAGDEDAGGDDNDAACDCVANDADGTDNVGNIDDWDDADDGSGCGNGNIDPVWS